MPQFSLAAFEQRRVSVVHEPADPRVREQAINQKGIDGTGTNAGRATYDRY
jgi:hypothetical protein